MSGLHLVKIGGRVTVHSVDPRSPADNGGVRPGDVLLRIDGMDASSTSMANIRTLLMSMDGETRILVIGRAKEKMTVRVVLKQQV